MAQHMLHSVPGTPKPKEVAPGALDLMKDTNKKVTSIGNILVESVKRQESMDQDSIAVNQMLLGVMGEILTEMRAQSVFLSELAATHKVMTTADIETDAYTGRIIARDKGRRGE